MRQNKLFTSIYVAGTGLSIAFTMVLFIIYYVKFAPVYPEYNRDRTLVINKMSAASKGEEKWNSCSGGVSPKIAEWVKELPHLDHVGMTSISPSIAGNTVLLPVSNEQLEVTTGYVDAGFWHVFTFRFLNGEPFDEASVKAELPIAILSESLAKRIFASTDVVGKYLSYNGKDLRVTGVVADASGTTPATAADLYVPLYYGGENHPHPHAMGLSGSVYIYMTATSKDDLETLRAEVIDVLERRNQEDEKWTHFWMEQPDVWWKNTFRETCNSAPDIAGAIRGILYMLLALLFIPAINLCGMISSRMEERMSELGVRKAYGATNASLITQVLTENMMLTFVGGLVGLALAYLVAWSGSEWIFHLFSEWVDTSGVPPTYTAEMLFNPTLFLLVFGLCIVLNLISALVPTVLALRHSIIYSIQMKR